MKEGQGTQKWLDGSFYQGPFKGGKRHGKGVHQWPSGEVRAYLVVLIELRHSFVNYLIRLLFEIIFYVKVESCYL